MLWVLLIQNSKKWHRNMFNKILELLDRRVLVELDARWRCRNKLAFLKKMIFPTVNFSQVQNFQERENLDEKHLKVQVLRRTMQIWVKNINVYKYCSGQGVQWQGSWGDYTSHQCSVDTRGFAGQTKRYFLKTYGHWHASYGRAVSESSQ